jgi:SAM-dependent methyltransferase
MVHRTAISNAKLFFDTYVQPLGPVIVVEIGSQNINGSIKSEFPGVTYIGVDFAAGKDVDVVIEDPYHLPFPDNHAEVVVTSSCFEHSEFFWLTFMECVRILKPGGVLYLNAPANGPVHGYPVDCWRFYPDAGRALAKWAQRNGQDVVELEAYISEQNEGRWNDCVAILLKDQTKLATYPRRIIDSFTAFTNGRRHGSDDYERRSPLMEDQRAIEAIQKFVKARLQPI